MANRDDWFNIRSTLEVDGRTYVYWRLQGLEEQGLGNISRLPFSIKVLLEAAVRQYDGKAITAEHVRMLARWADERVKKEVPFKPARISSKTSPVSRRWWTSPLSAPRWPGSAAIRSGSTPWFPWISSSTTR